MRSWRIFIVAMILLSLVFVPGLRMPVSATTSAQYVIIFQGDGMALQHVRAGGMFANGAAGTLSFEAFPYQTTMTHNNASGGTTDSAASATAMATGVKVNNGVISVQLPGNGSELPTLLEIYKTQGKSTGLVTASYLTDASPAAYGAHETSRNNTANIANDFLTQTQPNILLGGGGNGFTTTTAAGQGYTVVADRNALLALNTETQTRVAGGFGSGLIPADGTPGRSSTLPTLPEMTQQALAVLDNDPDGFFVFIEHEGTDEYSHANDTAGMVRSAAELSSAVQTAVNWVDNPGNSATWSNTVIVVLADHETGGLTVTETNPQAGVVPAVNWTSTGHTQTVVPVYARGAGAEQITGAQIDNTAIFTLLSPSGPAATPTATPTTAPGSPVTVSFQDGALPTAGYAGTTDTILSQAAPSANYGSDPTGLADGDDPSGSANDKSTLLRWDVSSISTGSIVTAGSVTLNITNLTNGSYPLYGLLQPWVENEATWTSYAAGSNWQTAGAQGSLDRGATIGTLGPVGTGLQTIALNAAGVALVQSWIDNPAQNLGLIIADPATTDGADWDSSEAATASNRPRLQVTYTAGGQSTPTPVPPTPTNTPVPATPTATAVPGTVRFAVIGDFGDASTAEADVASLIAGWNVDFMTTVGDNRYGATTYDQVIGQYYCAFLRDAGAGTYCNGNGSATNGFFPATGNHDYSDGGGLNEYLNYFTLPGAGIATSGTSGNERYYDFVQGPLHFFVIDSQGALSSGSDLTAQQNWLQAQLAASTAPFQIVLLHHPPYSSSSSHGSTPAMQWSFEAWGADAVLGGHDHTYERLQIGGIPYFVNGLGGRSIYALGTPVAGSVVRYNGDYGAMLVDASSSGITYQFINRSGAVIDSYVFDPGAPTPTATSTPTGAPAGSLGIRISSSGDDVEQLTSDGSMYLDSSDLELGDDFAYFGEQAVGLRFTGVNVPQGATITAASIEFETDETGSDPTVVTIWGQAADNAAAFGSGAYDLTGRPLTAASVGWNIPAWNTVNEKHQTPDLAAVVQEIVNRPGWAANGAVVFLIDGTGVRTAESYDGEAANAPLLHIEYTMVAPTPTTSSRRQPRRPHHTPVPPTATPTNTNTPVPPTATPTSTTHRCRRRPRRPTPTRRCRRRPPTTTATHTPVPPTATPTNTNTPVPPTATPTNTPVPPTPTPTPTPVATEMLYVSSTSGGNVAGVSFADEDILAYNMTTGAWSLYFDGSDVGVGGSDLSGFSLRPDGTILMSFSTALSLGNLGSVDELGRGAIHALISWREHCRDLCLVLRRLRCWVDDKR